MGDVNDEYVMNFHAMDNILVNHKAIIQITGLQTVAHQTVL
jgi:hypothetical protein